MSNQVVTAPNIGEHTLRALQIADQSFPVRSVAVAAGVALSILESVQTLKTGEERFIVIGRNCCFIVETIICRVQGDQNLDDPTMLQHVDTLVTDLRYIEKRIKKANERSRLKKVFSRQLDRVTIQRCQERLAHAMILFGFQHESEIRMQLASMQTLLLALLEASSNPLSLWIQPQPHWRIPSSSVLPPRPPQIQGSSIRDLLPILAPVTLPSGSQGPQVSVEQPVNRIFNQPRVDEITQQQMDMTPSSTTYYPARMGPSSFQTLSPAAGIGRTSIAGNGNDTRDDSFNVFGTGNNIYFSIVR